MGIIGKVDNLNKEYMRTFFRVVAIAKLIIASMLLSLFVSIQTQTVRRYSISQLEQVGTQLDLLYDTLQSVSHQILADHEIYTVLIATNIDRLQEFRANRRLRSIASGHPYIRYLGFYNPITERYVGSACVADREVFGPDFFYDHLEGRNFVSIRRPIGTHFATQYPRNAIVYTFAFTIRVRDSYLPGLIILDVDAAYLDNILNHIRAKGQYQQLVFIDDSNNIVTARTAKTNDSRFLITDSADLTESDLSIFERVGSHLEESGHIFYWRWFITYAKSQQMNWQLINMVAYSHILSGLIPVILLSLLLTAISLIFGYILSKRVSATLYQPIGKLYERFVSSENSGKNILRNELEQLNDAFLDMYAKADQLEQGLINAYNLSKHQYLNYLLEGEIAQITASASAYERLNIRLDSPFYAVVLIECTPKDGANPDSELFISPYVLERITKEVVGHFYSLEFSRIRENIFAVLIYSDASSLNKSFSNSLEKAILAMESECLADVTICIGGVCDSWENINLSFEQAMIALKSRSLDTNGKVFYYQEETDPIRADQYFSGLHEKFTSYICIGDIEACEREFDTALRSLGNVSFEMAKTYFLHMALSVLDSFAAYFYKDDESTRVLLKLLGQVNTTQNTRALRRVIISYVTAMIHRFDTVRKTGREKVVEQIKDYIEECYNNPDLSLSTLAERAGLTPAYLGKTFSTCTGMSFNDYLAKIRMRKSAEMLIETEDTVQKISKAVGILNTSYFYSLFKKQYYMTPMQYREERRGLTWKRQSTLT